MRVPRIPNVLKIIWTLFICLFVSPMTVFAVLMAMFEDTFLPKNGVWTTGIAWWPTDVGDGTVVWMEKIEKGRWGSKTRCRRPGDEMVRPPWELP